MKGLKTEVKELIDQAVVDVIESISKVAATKNDLKKCATKDDLKKLATKVDHAETTLSNEIKDVKRQINDLKADVPTPQEIQDHEKRIKRLETAVYPS